MAKLIAEQGPRAGTVFSVVKPVTFLIGRGQGAQIDLPDDLVSRRHCQIEVNGDMYLVRDLGSSNGTLVNGTRITHAALNDGDRLQVGSTVFRFAGNARCDSLAGREIGGYRIEALVGRGGMGSVYRAVQLSLGRTVALKVLAAELAKDAEFLALFLREARAAAALAHPNIVKVYEVGSFGDTHFFSMEYIGGGTVEEALARRGALPVRDALRIARDACEGLVYAESKKLVHRDIKPGNLLIDERNAVKICDLGIAGTFDMEHEEPFRGGGSPHYIAPEQALGRPVDSRADIYALGASLYTMLAGRTPFTGASSREIAKKHVTESAPPLAEQRPGIPKEVADLVAWMMAKSPADRPASPVVVRDALDAQLARLHAKKRRGAFSFWIPVSLGAAIVLVALAAGVYLAKQWHEHKREAAWTLQVQEFRGRVDALLARGDYAAAGAQCEDFLREHANATGLEWIPAKSAEAADLERARLARAREGEAEQLYTELLDRKADDTLLRELVTRYGGTGAAAKAAQELDAREAKRKELADWEARADDEFASIKRKSDAYLAERNFRLATELWSAFPERFKGSEAHHKAAYQRTRIEAQARTELAAALAAARQKALAGDERAAAEILAGLALPRSISADADAARKALQEEIVRAKEAASRAARDADLAAIAGTDAAVTALLRSANFKSSIDALRQLRDALQDAGLRAAVEARIGALESAQRYFRRLCLDQAFAPRPFELLEGVTVTVIRIRETAVDYYEKPDERRAKRMSWEQVSADRFLALLRGYAATDDEKAACDALARELTRPP